MITRTYYGALWQSQNLPKPNSRPAREPKRGGPATLLSESQALECRARHEFFGWSLAHCAAHYGTSVQYMRSLLDYVVRAFLIAEPKHANLGANT